MSTNRYYLLSLTIVMLGISIAILQVLTAPKPGKKKPESRIQLVETVPLQSSVQRPYWQAGGTVTAYQQLSLTAQVAGRIEWINHQAVPGAWLKKDTVLARVESVDFELAVTQALSNLAQAKAELAVEQGQAILAKEELQLSGSTLSASDRALVLREPQIAAAHAKVRSAEAMVKQARLNQQRTHIKMPFDGQVMSRSISVGASVSNSSALFSLLDTSRYWLEVKIPQSFLPWIDQQHPVDIRNPQMWQGEERTGEILSILPNVDAKDRQVKILVNIPDPLGLSQGTGLQTHHTKTKPVLLNDFVEVTIWGRDIQNIYQFESTLMDADHKIWVVNKDNQLQRRAVRVEYVGREKIWGNIDVEDGDRLLRSNVKTASPGMRVTVEETKENVLPANVGIKQLGVTP